MDVLAAIASDPTPLPLFAVLAFAVGMYPVGMLFGCRPCCEVCQSCCRDAVGQIVIDFDLEATGEQLVKETPWTGNGTASFLIDGTMASVVRLSGGGPQFILEGQQSGARLLAPPTKNSDGTRSPLASYRPMGPGFRTEFIDGEAVTVTPIPSTSQVQAPSLTAVVGDCPILEPDPNLGSLGVPPVSFSGNPGKWSWSIPPAADAYTVDCQGDEGSVIFDVESQDGRGPDFCERCEPVVERLMFHPANFLLDMCSTRDVNPNQLLDFYGPSGEMSGLSVRVPLMAFGPKASENCGEELVASATTRWYPPTGAFIISRGTTYGLTPAEQDCVPFSAWTESPPEPCESFEEQLIMLSATACFGSGFECTATEPSGVPGEDDGPLAAVEVTAGGSGYAVLGRLEPTISVAGAGSGADIQLLFTETEDGCGRPVWYIDQATIGSGGGGSGYVENEALTLTVASPGVQVSAAELRVVSGREEPEISISIKAGPGESPIGPPSSGIGADLAASFTSFGTPPLWKVESITINDGGSGYTYGSSWYGISATIADFGNFVAYGAIQTSVSQPTITLFGGTGTSAALAVTLASNGGTPETWGIASVSITSGGAGYLANDQLSIDIAAGDVQVQAAAVKVATVSGTGAITGLTVTTAGQYYHDDGEIESLSITSKGEYWRATGEIDSITVVNGGTFYDQSESEPAIVADVTISINQASPSAGSGASITATVDDDPESDSFGEIVGLTIASGGSGYLARRVEPSACSGPGGLYRSIYYVCGWFQGDDADPGPTKNHLFRRGCPDYTYEITIQEPAS